MTHQSCKIRSMYKTFFANLVTYTASSKVLICETDTYTCAHTYMHAHTHIYTCIYTCIYGHVHLYAHKLKYLYMHACRFTTSGDQYTYKYNPCYPYTDGPACTKVAVSYSVHIYTYSYICNCMYDCINGIYIYSS